jgi:hypothetical protein
MAEAVADHAALQEVLDTTPCLFCANFHAGGVERARSVSVVRETQNPPDWEAVEPRRTRGDRSPRQRDDREPLPVRSYRDRRASRPRSTERSETASNILRPGDKVTVVEHHPQEPSDDYDYYDKDGMRVRVREI